MSWREILGVVRSTKPPCAHNPQNAHKPIDRGDCADIADSAYGDLEVVASKLLEALADASQGFDIGATELRDALAPSDIDDWRAGAISADTLAAFARSLVQRREMDQGRRPNHYTERATCKRCGPIWLWCLGDVSACPWCWNRMSEKPIPRPCAVHCGACAHFERIDHPHLGDCAKGESSAPAGCWDTDRRHCHWWTPLQLIERGIPHGQ